MAIDVRSLVRRAVGWANPSYGSESALPEDEWRRLHDGLSQTITRVAFTLVAASLFCVITLGAPDVNLVSADARINVPVANTEVSYTGFLFVGPLVLIGISCYLHVFIEQRIRLDASQRPTPPVAKRMSPDMFSMPVPSARLVSGLLVYWMLPGVLAVFAWKAMPRPDAPLLLFVTTAVTAVMLALQIRRFGGAAVPSTSRIRRFTLGGLWLVLAVVLLLLIPLSVMTWRVVTALGAPSSQAPAVRSAAALSGVLPTRRLQLYGALLDKKNLSGLYAPFADLRKANLQETDLEGANLSHADLGKADLSKTTLTDADLTGANLEGANLTEATLNGANLRNVRIDDFTTIDIKWRRVSCILSLDLDRDCLNAPDLAWSDLSGARLRGAVLREAHLIGVDLRYADLTDADVTGADLRFADLRQAVLPHSVASARLDGALTDVTAGAPVDAPVRIQSRRTDSCLQAPDSAFNGSLTSISSRVPCVADPDRRVDWRMKRVPNFYITFKSSIGASDKLAVCLDGTGFSAQNVPVQVWQCNDDYDNQHWRVRPALDGYLLLEKRDTGFCLDSGYFREGEPPVHLNACNTTNHNQHWKIHLRE